MESRRDNRLSLVLAVALTLIFTVGTASAQEGQAPTDRNDRLSTAIVYTTEQSAVVEANTNANGGTVAAPSGRSTKRRQCRLEPDTTNVGFANTSFYAEHQGEASFYLYCDDQYIGIVWRKLDPTPGGRSSPSPKDLAEHLREVIPMPEVSIRINPQTGLVGTESWFWIEGYAGEPIQNSTDAFGSPVEVEARVARYEWSFGDGSKFVSESPGSAYPQRSEVRHIFQRAPSTGYSITLSFNFSVRYRVAGGEWLDLPGISRTTTAAYRVRESQAVISR